MKAAAFETHGGPDVITTFHLPDPVPGPDEVVIRTHYMGLNFADIYRRRGEYSVEPPSPYVNGYEGAGVIHAVGRNVSDFKTGDRVAFAHVPRANAELVKAPAWKVIPVPENIGLDVASGLLLQGLTAHYLTHDSFKVNAGHTVVIHSASGGVGLLLVQLCKELGARAIGTVSTAGKVQAALDAGADHVLVRSQGDWKNQVVELTGGDGAHVVYDGLGASLNESLEAVRPKGTVVYFGWAGGTPPKINPQILMDESKSLVGGELWSHIATREALRSRATELFTLVQKGKLAVKIAARFPLHRASEAHRELESGRTQGKILLES